MRTRIATALIATLVGLGSTVAADPLADSIARHADADVTALRAQLPGDPAIRCTLGAVYARRGDLSRAALYLAECYEAALPDAIGVEVRRAIREIKKPLREQLAELAITSHPLGLTVEVDALPGEKLVAPVTVWVKPGAHVVRAWTDRGAAISNSVTTAAYSRSTILLDAGTPSTAPPKNGVADFENENALEKHDGQPPDVKRGSIMPAKLRGEPSTPAGPQIADPLATHAAPAPLAIWLGLRVGGGMFDDGATTAHLRPSIATAARFALAGDAFLAARLDWTRRGGAVTGMGNPPTTPAIDTPIDTLGASAGLGYTLVHGAVALAAIGQLRGDLRFADTRDAMAVRRAGLSIAAGLEAAFTATPFTAGLRVEQGLTELVTGYRDRALVVELGIDWR